MYVQRVELKNIRSFKSFEMTFEAPYAGWHVVIGDNATGKSTLLRSIALGFMPLVDPVKPYIRGFLRHRTNQGSIIVNLLSDRQYDIWLETPVTHRLLNGEDIDIPDKESKNKDLITLYIDVKANQIQNKTAEEIPEKTPEKIENGVGYKNQKFSPGLWTRQGGWFCASYGPFRRIDTRKSPVATDEWEDMYQDDPFVSPHISLFNQTILFSNLIGWLKELRFKELEGKKSTSLTYILKLINEGGLLASGFKIAEISSDGVFFETSNGARVSIVQLSDGYRSVLSITLDLIRQLLRIYDEETVFQNIAKNQMSIDLPGVVMIDEIDAHLHPSWQVRIGKWFTQFFPKIQFIVTTHSPLICQSAHPGSIWRLATPDSKARSGEVTGSDYNRLIYGNVLDAYGTDLFGKDVERSSEASDLLDELAQLNLTALQTELKPAQKKRRRLLQALLPDSASFLDGAE